MKSIIQQFTRQSKLREKAEAVAIQSEINNPATESSRRNFLKKAAMGGIALGGFMSLSVEDTIARSTSEVNRSSSPSELKITDMRV
ncbi:MAG: twin-arginine translocation signal domain-containing protein, partial [Bacteroidetes bacterium]